MPLRTLVAFATTAFNTTEPQDDFINPCCFGDDVCRYLMKELEAKGISVDPEPGQEDFGWYFRYSLDGIRCCFVVASREEDEADAGNWIGWVERERGFLGSLLGRRRVKIPSAAVHAIHEILSSDSRMTAIRWHAASDFHRGNEENGSPEPR